MSSSGPSSPTAGCGCCEGVTEVTPVLIQNPPSLSSISFRVGIQPQFKETMLARLASYPALASLTTRSDDDLAIDLLDAWATVADVLTFYQERIANEGYLRTAKERVSVLQLARSIGYELSPGVAATAYLAFTIDTSGSVSQTSIAKGTRVQSVPLQGQTPPEMPQTFETIEAIVAYPEFNELRPQLTRAQMYADINSGDTADGLNHVFFSGTSTKLSPGDKLLFVSAAGGVPLALRTVSKVTPNSPSSGQTDVALASDPNDQTLPGSAAAPSPTVEAVGPPWPGTLNLLDQSDVAGIMAQYPAQPDLVAFLTQQGWDPQEFASILNSFAGSLSTSQTDVQVFALRTKTGIFGNSAPKWNTLPPSVIQTQNVTVNGSTVALPGFPNNWDGPSYPIYKDSQGNSYDPSNSTVYLSNSFPAIAQGEWVALRDATSSTTMAFTVASTFEESRADFLVSGKVTGLKLNLSGSSLSNFTMRGTTAYAQSEELELADIAESAPIGGSQIPLGTFVAGLEVGQMVAVSGQLALQPGQSASEIAAITAISPYAPGFPFTTISVEPLGSTSGLANSYTRESFAVNANVALATHGATVSGEVLGSGDPSQPYTRFTLKQASSSSPLTFIPSTTDPSGEESTLSVWVSSGASNILWNQATNLYQLAANSRSYAVRIQDDLSVNVLFGNARPPVGSENITATYRVGIGSSGMVAAGQLTLLSSRPLGLKAVTNPLPAIGAADPQNIDDARKNAPLQVLTLGRIVSAADCEHFAASFPGIGKAKAVASWEGETQFIRLIVASAMQGQVAGTLLSDLQGTISNFSDPFIQVRYDSYKPVTFSVVAKLLTAADHDPGAVEQDVMAALQSAFSFQSMDFGEQVNLSDVISTIQDVDGVVAVEVTALYTGTQAPPPSQPPPNFLPCAVDQLLTLNPDSQGVALTEWTQP
jgi:hypothetical protein